MSSRLPLIRAIALVLAEHAGRVLARKRAFWARGMEEEARHIADDWQALRWAVGCVLASYKSAAKSLPVWDNLARIFLACPIFYFSYDNLLGPAWVVGCYAHASPFIWRLLNQLPYDFFTCVDWPSAPILIQLGSFLAGALFALAAVQTVRGRRNALAWFAAAFAASSVIFIIEQALPAVAMYSQSGALGSLIAHIAISKAIIPALVANAIWLVLFRRSNRFDVLG